MIPPDPTQPGSVPAALKPRSYFNNWITAVGAVLAVGALFSFALLVAMDFSESNKNPYLGILTYIVAPIFLIAGIVVALTGAFLERKFARQHLPGVTHRWSVDFEDPRQRRFLLIFGGGTAVFLMLSAFGSYQTYHYSESTTFCGEVCHRAMGPELRAYQRGAHARVECVACHIGSGAKWFVKAKINGTHQLIAYTFDNYSRPIGTPIKNLRPAQDICEKCHWPEKFLGNVDLNFEHYLNDKKNTGYAVRLLMRVNTGRPGSPPGGIHWHVSPDSQVEYYAADEKRQDIVWMKVTNKKDGTSRIFRNEEFTGEPPAGQTRVMDCMDCHNRPAHVFPTANDAVELALAKGTLSSKLPNIKRAAVQAMLQKDITTSENAPQKIADFLKAKYKDNPDTAAAVAEVQKIYAATIFPERKADWRVYPNNIGHKDWPGCFRCHDDKHKTASGELVRASDCNSCHTILAQGAGTQLGELSANGQEFRHPGGDYDAKCSDCHNGAIQGK